MTDDGVWFVGRVVDVATGEPLAEASVRAGQAGVLTDELGWFRFHVTGSSPHELIVERLGHSTSILRFSGDVDDQVFYVQDLDLRPCERILVSGLAARRNEVVLHVVDAADGEPVAGRGYVSVEVVGSAESVIHELNVDHGDLRLPVDGGGVYSIRIVVDGYDAWSAPVFVVPFDTCDERRMAAVKKTVRVARQAPAGQLLMRELR